MNTSLLDNDNINNEDTYVSTNDTGKGRLAKALVLAVAGAAVVGCATQFPSFLSKTEETPNQVMAEIPEEQTWAEMEENFDEMDGGFLTSLVSKDCSAIRNDIFAPPANAYRNIEQVTQGYNIYKGTPFSIRDTGFGARMFALDWSDVTQDTTHRVYPSAYDVAQPNRCSSDTKVKISSTEKQLQDNLSWGVSSGGSGTFRGITGSFKASADFHSSSNEISNEKQSQATAVATCTVAQYRLREYNPPCVNEDVMSILELIAENPEDTNLLSDFYNSFGTHAVLQVDMGAKVVIKTSLSTKDLLIEKEKGYELKLDTEVSGFGFSASSGRHLESNHQSSTSFEKINKQIEIETIGTPLPDGENLKEQLEAWVAEKPMMTQTPQPVGNMKLIPVATILERSLNNDNSLSDDKRDKFNTVITNLKQHLDGGGYCEWMVRNGLLDNCDRPSDEMSVTVQKKALAAKHIKAGHGSMTTCPAGGVLTAECGAGKNGDCDGYYSWGQCQFYDFAEGSQFETIKGAKDWHGQYLQCDGDGAMIGMCTSGSKRNCDGGRLNFQIKCNSQLHTDRGKCNDIVQRDFHDNNKQYCDAGKVMVGRCAGGGKKDCRHNGDKVVSWAKCCNVKNEKKYTYW